MTGYNCDIEKQIKLLLEILSKNTPLFDVIKRAPELGIDEYYIGAGCICQTVWNYQNGLDLMYGISDIDFVYFDNDLSYEKENVIVKKAKDKFAYLPVKIDVKNEARVHIWYKEHFGYDIAEYDSLESAINSFPTTATSVGVRFYGEKFVVYAPFGLNDMFGQIIRANKAQIKKEIYIEKCEKWIKKWNTLKIIEW